MDNFDNITWLNCLHPLTAMVIEEARRFIRRRIRHCRQPIVDRQKSWFLTKLFSAQIRSKINVNWFLTNLGL